MPSSKPEIQGPSATSCYSLVLFQSSSEEVLSSSIRQTAKVFFVEYILESIKRLPVVYLILIGSEMLAPCLFMFLIILESSHLLRKSLFVLIKSRFSLISRISMTFYGILWYLFVFTPSKYLFWGKWFKYRLWTWA